MELNSIKKHIQTIYDLELERFQIREWAINPLSHYRSNIKDFHTQFYVVSHEVLNDRLRLQVNSNREEEQRKYLMDVYFYEKDQFRVHIINSYQQDTIFLLDHLLGPIKLVPLSSFTVYSHHNNMVLIELLHSTVTINLNPLEISFRNNLSKQLIMTIKPYFYGSHPSSIIQYHQSPHLSGIPSHSDSLLLRDTIRDRPYQLYNQDRYLWPVNSRGCMYGCNPLLFNWGTYGQSCLFWRNTSESYFDISTSTHREVMVLSEVNDLDMVVTLNYETVRELYTKLQPIVGKSFLPPSWSLCYQHSRYSFMSSDDLLETEAGYDYHKIPVDAFYLDLHHTGEGMKYFTWNEERFPDPSSLLKHFDEGGRKIITIQDPHLRQEDGYHVYDQFRAQDLLVKREGEVFTGKAWPGQSVFIDFIDSDAQELWAEQYQLQNYKHSEGISVWNDLNEPTVQNYGDDIECMPKDCEHRLKLPNGTKLTLHHRQVRLCYGLLQMKGTCEGLKKRDQETRRNIAFTRSFYTGINEYAIVWTADAESTFKYLTATTPMLLSYSLVGMSFNGGDVPGFQYYPEEDLCRRWYQLGSFQPFFRSHSNLDTPRREPWLFSSKTLNNVRQSIIQRYLLLPFWYTQFYDNHKTSMPALRPLWMNFPQLENTYQEEQIHCIGDTFIIVPVTSRNQKWVTLDLFKKSQNYFYNYWNGKILKQESMIKIEDDRIPVFVIGGQIIISYNLMPFKCSRDLIEKANYNIWIYADQNGYAKGSFYLDDGITYAYEKGSFLFIEFEFKDGILNINRINCFQNPLFDKYITKIQLSDGINEIQVLDCNISLLGEQEKIKIRKYELQQQQ